MRVLIRALRLTGGMDASPTFELAGRSATPVDVVHAGLRVVVAFLVAEPALSKVLTYGNSVSFFDSLGIPYPAVMVLLAGVVEVAAVVLLVAGVADRLAAAALVPVMLVAIAYAGLDWKNLSVLLGALAILVLSVRASRSWGVRDLYRG